MPHEALLVCFVCSGNICRSPMGEVVLQAMVEARGLSHRIDVSSAGTGDWHIGERADRRTVDALAARGYDGSQHRAQLYDPTWLPSLDLVLALDRGDQRTVRALATDDTGRAKIELLRRFDPAVGHLAAADLDVPDPYYASRGVFDAVLDLVEDACTGLLEHLQRWLVQPGGTPYPAARA